MSLTKLLLTACIISAILGSASIRAEATRCHDASLRTVDRLLLKIETGSKLTQQEKQCQKSQAIKQQYRFIDELHLEEALTDLAFRDQFSLHYRPNDEGNIQSLEGSNASMTLLGTYLTAEGAHSEKTTLPTVKGYVSTDGSQKQ